MCVCVCVCVFVCNFVSLFLKIALTQTCLTTEGLTNIACILILKKNQSFSVDIYCRITCEFIGEATFNDHVIKILIPSA